MQILLKSCENRSRATYTHTSWCDWLATHEQKAFEFKGAFPFSPPSSFYTPYLIFFLMVPDSGEIVKDQAHYKW